MIVLKGKNKPNFLHSLEQKDLELVKQQKPKFFNKYFEEND